MSAILILALVVGCFVLPFEALAQPEVDPNSTIGQEAERVAASRGDGPSIKTEEDVKGLVVWIKVAGVLLLIAVLILLERAANLVDFNPFRNWKLNRSARNMWVFFAIAMFAALAYNTYHSMGYLLGPSASEHGVQVDNLLVITTIICGIAFVVTEILLIVYAVRYTGRPGRKALFYPDNHRLELLWTVIPAIGLAGMIIPGLKYWGDITSPEYADGVEPTVIEVVGEQFIWNARYPGKDMTLGGSDFRQISAENPLGIDSTDKAGADDFLTRELHLPANRPVNIKLRSKDVLHGFYLPHFRTNLYAAPGMPTQVFLTPTITSEEMKAKMGNPDFTYELVCSQLCGGSHYKMRLEVVVHPEEEYDAWYASQVNPPAEEPATEDAEGTDEADSDGDTQEAGTDEPDANTMQAVQTNSTEPIASR